MRYTRHSISVASAVALCLLAVCPWVLADSTNSPAEPVRQTETNRIDITTTTSNTYTRAKVLRVNPDSITVMHSSGIATIPFAELPPELKQRYQEQAPTRSVTPSRRRKSRATSQPSDLDTFRNLLKIAGVDSSIISRVSQSGDSLTIVVANAWHYQPYQLRLQAAQNLWETWARIRSPNDPDKARLDLTDQNGNRVGGSRWLAGSLIWVKKD